MIIFLIDLAVVEFCGTERGAVPESLETDILPVSVLIAGDQVDM